MSAQERERLRGAGLGCCGDESSRAIGFGCFVIVNEVLVMGLKEQLDEVGLIGPFDLDDITAMDRLAPVVLENQHRLNNLHIHAPVVTQVLEDSALQGTVARVFGDDAIMWRTNFFVKKAGSGEVPWHHDKHFEDGDAPIDLNRLGQHLSILIAVTDVARDGGEVRYLSGSHLPVEGVARDVRPYHLKDSQEHFINLPAVVEPDIVSLPLQKGQFALFHSSLLHHSLPFEAGGTRISMIARLAKAHVSIPVALARADDLRRFG